MMLLAERRRPGGALGNARKKNWQVWRARRRWPQWSRSGADRGGRRARGFGTAVRPRSSRFRWRYWLAYSAHQGWAPDSGASNFFWPVFGWMEKGWPRFTISFVCRTTFAGWASRTLLAFAGLTVQAMYFLGRPDREDAWWRFGAVTSP